MTKTLVAIPGLMLALAGSAFAGPTWQEQSAQTAFAASDSAPAATSGVSLRAVYKAVRIPAKSPAFLTNFVASGPAENGVPCYGCVNGAPTDALGLPGPFNYVPTGTGQQYDVSWTNLTFKGTCKVAVVVAAGKTVVYKTSYMVTGIDGSGSLTLGFNAPAATYSGQAMLTGKVTCGGAASTATAPIVFQ